MTHETFSLKFAWGSRKEDLDECAGRFANLLHDLSITDPAFATFQAGRKKERLYHMPVDPDCFKHWLGQGLNRKDVGNEVIRELGFTASLILNDENDVGFPFRIHCGCYSPHVYNICSIIFPKSGQAASRLLNVPMLIKVAKAVIANWRPDDGVISSDQCRRIVAPRTFGSEAGWITYLSQKFNELSGIPKSARIVKAGDGRLIIATEELFSSANEGHLDVVRKLSHALESAAR